MWAGVHRGGRAPVAPLAPEGARLRPARLGVRGRARRISLGRAPAVLTGGPALATSASRRLRFFGSLADQLAGSMRASCVVLPLSCRRTYSSADLGHAEERRPVGGQVSGDLRRARALPEVPDAVAAAGACVEAQRVDAGAVRGRRRSMVEDRDGALSIGQPPDED